MKTLMPWSQSDDFTSLCLDYFHTVCRREFQGYYSTRLWDSFLPQVLHAESSIRHAILALSAMHFSAFACEDAQSRSKFRLYAISHFAKGARELNEKLDHGLYSHKLALIASLIFTHYELLSGSEMISLLHLRYGATIVTGLHRRPTSLMPELSQSPVIRSTAPLEASSPGVDVDFSEITDAFARAVIEIACYGVRYQFDTLAEPSLPQNFMSLSGPYGARYHLDLIVAYMYTSLDFRQESIRTLPSRQLTSSISSQITVVKDLLSRWSSLHNTLRSTTATMGKQESTISEILETHYRLASLKLATHFFDDESIYDSYTSAFQEIVDRCETVLASGSNSWKDRFSADSAVVHPLYFVALKCRQGALRRRALALLSHAGREAAHDGRKVAAAARWVMEREEIGAAELGNPALPASTDLSSTGIDVRARIRGVARYFDESRRFVTILCSRKTKDGEWVYLGGMAWYDGAQRDMDADEAQELARQVERYSAWHATVQ